MASCVGRMEMSTRTNDRRVPATIPDRVHVSKLDFRVKRCEFSIE